jgi:hypothetical protein
MSSFAWIQTYTGRHFHPFLPSPREVCIEDIAHSLANQCRFGGHCKEFYSVAQHCFLMGCMANGPLVGEALLHDAAEAYIVDIPRPIKQALPLQDIEARIESCIAERFGLSYPWSHELHALDLRMLATEKQELMRDSGSEWEALEGVEPFGLKIHVWKPFEAKLMFLRMFKNLCNEGRLTP